MSRFTKLVSLLFFLFSLQIAFSQSKKYIDLYNTALENFDEGNWEQAEQDFLAALDILEKENYSDSAVYAVCLNDLGFLYQNQGRFDETETILLQARDIYKNTIGVDAFKYLIVINDLGNLYAEIKEKKKAEQFYEEALAHLERNTEKESQVYANILNNIASLAVDRENYEKALEDYNEVLRILNKSKKKSPELASCLNNIGLCNVELKRYKEAETCYLEAIAIDKNVLGENDPGYWLDLINIATLYSEMNQREQALKYANEVIALNGNIVDLGLELNTEWLEKLKQANFHQLTILLDALLVIDKQMRTKEYAPERYELSKFALALCNDIRKDFGSEGDKLRILTQTNNWSLHAIQSILSLPNALELRLLKEEAFAFSELSKSVLLQTALQADQAYSFGDLPDSLASEEQEIQVYLNDLKAALLESGDEEEQKALRAELVTVQRAANELKTKIEQNYPKYHELKYAQKEVDLTAIQNQLKAESAIISYSLSDSMIYCFYLDKNNLEIYSKKIDKKEFSKRLHLFRRSLSDYEFLGSEAEKAKSDYTEQAYWFYQLLLQDALKGKDLKHLIIVPDQELGYLPFEAFLSQAAEASTSFKELPYLINQYQLSYNYSASLWLENQNARGNNNGLMFAAASSYKENKFKELRDKNTYRFRAVLEPLPAAEKEIQRLSDIFLGDFFQKEEATEKQFKENAANYGIIHLAMHGLLNKEKPILSSLAFTEDGDSLEDNFLQAYEISQMQLNADLVVLSACETGYGKVEKGEGVMSLARSFMYAGVPAMVVSMWQVNDLSTSVIMQIFYQELAKGKNKAEALQAAKLQYIEMADDQAAQPAFWAAFIQVGNSQAIDIKIKSNNNWWISMAVAALLLIFIIFVGKRFLSNNK